nr:hypothetical protein [Rhodoferax sp.]
MNKISNFLQSPANWGGMGLATLALVLSSVGLTQVGAGALALLGYAAGFGVGGMWFGFPKWSGNPWDALEFEDQGDARTSMLNALNAVRQLVDYNPQGRLPASLQSKVQDLCKQLALLLDQWERSKGQLSLEEGFHARHIALSYLPDALKTYMSIPQQFAMSKRLDNGQTAQETFNATLDDLTRKVAQLSEDLATQDAQAFLSHSQFLHEKFNPPRIG